MSCFCDRIIIGACTWEVRTLSWKSIETPTCPFSTMGNTLAPQQTATSQLKVSGSFGCLDNPCVSHLAPFQVTQEHLHAKAVLEEAPRNWWWFLHPQQVCPGVLAILPLSFLLHRVEKRDVLCKQLTMLRIQRILAVGIQDGGGTISA